MPNLPVLFIHAFPLDSRMWGPQLDAIGSSRRVLAPDLRGFGKSKQGVLPQSVDGHARDLIDLMDRSSTPKAIVVGLSMGGYIAWAMMRLAPERVAGLLLADTKASPDTPEARRGRDERIARVQRDGVAFLVDEMIPVLVAPGCDDAVKLNVRKMILEQDPVAVAAALRVLRDRPDSSALLGRIRVPATFVCGELDAITPPPVMQEMASQIPGASFVLAPGAGHLANLEAPALFNGAMFELFARCDG